MKKYSVSIATLFVFASLLLGVRNAHALTVSPPVKELAGNPGETVQYIVKLYNETKDAVTVKATATNFTAKENGAGEPEFADLGTEKESTHDLASWMSLPEGNITINPLDWQTVIINIEIPKDAEPGGHYAAAFFAPSKNEQAGPDGVSVDYKTGSLVLLTVTGEAKQGGNIKSFSLKNNKSFFEYVPVNMELRVENTGNVHFKPGGTIEIKNIFNKKAAELKVTNSEEEGGNVLPNSTRRYDLIWEAQENKDGPQNFWQKAQYEFKHFHFGRYAAIATVVLPQGQAAPLVLNFWIIPWQLLLIAFVGLVVLILLFRTYNRWIIKKARSGR